MVSLSSKNSAAEAPVVAVLERRGDQRFEMFSLLSLSDDRAVLTGPLLLEVGEVLRLSIVIGDGQVEVEARVDSIDLEQRALGVRFHGTPSADKRKLAAAAGSWPP